jgi:hypothetical protein
LKPYLYSKKETYGNGRRPSNLIFQNVTPLVEYLKVIEHARIVARKQNIETIAELELALYNKIEEERGLLIPQTKSPLNILKPQPFQ